MYAYTFIQQILRDMWARKLRSILALFGIVWGTVIVILLLALGKGFAIASQKNMGNLVDGTLFVILGPVSKAFPGALIGHEANIKASSIVDLKNSIPGIATASPMLVQRADTAFENKIIYKGVYGVDWNYSAIRKVELIPGSRFINPIDIKNNAFVVVISYRTKNLLFGNRNALGNIIKIKGINFTIIGVMQKQSKSEYNWHANSSLIPYSTFITMFGNSNVSFFVVFPSPTIEPAKVEADMRAFLAQKYHFARDDQSALKIFNTTKMFQFMRWFFIGIQIFLGICGSLTLAVGSLGVANIMFLIINERTREIGLRMALGAKARHIKQQVLLETLLMVSLGGAIGFLIAYLIITVLRYISLPDWLGQPVMSTGSIVATLIVLALLGVFAGYFPARRAAKMDPVLALSQ